MRVRRCRAINCHATVELPMHYCKQHEGQEADYLASRSKWVRGNETDRQRKYDRTVRVRNTQKQEQSDFYHTKEWSGIRQFILERDHYLCQYCRHYGRVTQGKIVDHIVPIEYDVERKKDINNLMVICSKCHRAKSAWEREYYGTGNCNSLN